MLCLIGFLSAAPVDLPLVYFTKTSKSFLNVSDKYRSAAEEMFGALGVRVVTGHCVLGGFLGNCSD